LDKLNGRSHDVRLVGKFFSALVWHDFGPITMIFFVV
jgi:hypothetical protein